jgi:hypothetical protein
MGTEHEREDLPYPPATADNWANPIDAGCDRNTEYTFFYTKSRVECIHTDVQLTKNVTPTTQFGFPFPLTMLLPRLRSKMAPTHCALPGETGPRFISNGLICHVWPPNDMETCMVVLQAEQNTDVREGGTGKVVERTELEEARHVLNGCSTDSVPDRSDICSWPAN